MPPVSDEIVEAVAQAMYVACHPSRGAVGWEWCQDRNEWFRDARAAIATLSVLGFGDVAKARRDALGEAARVADAHRSQISINEPLWHDGADWACDRIAAAIRALLNPPG